MAAIGGHVVGRAVRLAWAARRLGGFAWLVIAFAVMFAVGRGGDLIPVGVLHFLIATASLLGAGSGGRSGGGAG